MENYPEKRKISNKLKSNSDLVFNKTKILFNEIKNSNLLSKFFLMLIFASIAIYINLNQTFPQYIEIPLEIIFHYLAIQVLFLLIKISIISLYKRKYKYTKDYEDNFILGVGRVSNLLFNIVFLVVLLLLIGVNVLNFLMSISIFAVALVIMFNAYISNIISGMILMFTNDMQLKEFIKIGDKKGKIIDIKFLNTHIRTDDGDIILIPNSKLISEEITNYSKSQIKRIKFNFTLGSEHYKYIDELEEYITKNVCEEYKHLVESEEEILIKALEIKKDETQFRIEIIVSRFNFKIENKINNYLSKQIIKFLSDKENNKEKEEEISKEKKDN